MSAKTNFTCQMPSSNLPANCSSLRWVVLCLGWQQVDGYFHWLIVFIAFDGIVLLSLFMLFVDYFFTWSDLNLTVLSCLPFSTRPNLMCLVNVGEMISLLIPRSFSRQCGSNIIDIPVIFGDRLHHHAPDHETRTSEYCS